MNLFDRESTVSHRLLIIVLCAVSCLTFIVGNNVISLTHPNEVFYMQSAREMIRHHSWMTPYLFDAPQFEKPILCYWLFILTIKIFGDNAFASRLCPAIFGVLTVLLTYVLAWLMFHNKRVAFLSGLVMATCAIQIALSRSVLMDVVFSFWVVAALAVFYWAYCDPRRKRTGIVLMFAFAGLAVLTKGVLGIVFVAVVVLLFLALRRDLAFLKNPATGLGLAAFLLIALPWHLWMINLYGWDFVREYWNNVHVRRIFEAEHPRINAWYFYPLTLFVGMFPWMVFIFQAGRLCLEKLPAKTEQAKPFLLLISWVVGVLVVVQPAQSKLASYILPAFPAIAILLAVYLEERLWGQARRPSLGIMSGGYGLLGVVLMAVGALVFALRTYPQYIPDPRPVFFIIALLGIWSVVAVWVLRARRYRYLLWLAPAVSTVILAAAFAGGPYAEPWVSCRLISRELLKVDPSNTPIITSKFFTRGVRYYTGRPIAVMDIEGKQFFSPHPILFLDRDDKVDRFIRRQPGSSVYAIVRHADVEHLQRIASNGEFRFEELASVGGKFLVRLSPQKDEKIAFHD